MNTAAKPQLKRAAYHCLLEVQPDFLVPAESRQHRPGEFVVSPHVTLADPAAIGLKFAANVAVGSDVAWVRDTNTFVVLPYQLRSATAKVLRATTAGSPIRGELSPQTLAALAQAGILINPKRNVMCEKSFRAEQQRRLAKFQRGGYSPLGSPIHPFHIGALRKYLRYKVRTGAIWLGDAQSKRRYVAHNEPVVRYFHHQLTQLMSATVGQTVKPSYVYFASYQDGADLKKHTDREQCEFSITMQIDFSPEPRGKTPWPICLDVNGKTVTVRQALGEALLYKGIELPHFRSRIPKGCTSTSIFFHYVPVGFKGSLD